MGILNDIDNAAWDLEHGRIDGLYPVSNNFTIVANHNTRIVNTMFDVYSYTTRVAMVNRNENGDWDTFVHRDAFHHTITTSKHVRRFLSALLGRIDWDALYKACDRECDKETISGNGAQFINVREVA
jgi:hypothetical protein|nr:MAG TPA: tRNA methyltransferase [Herelleviridae sp.]